MPWASKAQAGFMWSQHPKIARKMAHDAGMSSTHKTKKSKTALKAFRALPYHSKTASAKAARRRAPASVKRKRRS